MIEIDNESMLLLSCSRPQMNGETADRIRGLLQERLDWSRVLEAARLHGVWPILYHNLKSACLEAVPKNVLTELQRAYLFNAKRNMVLTRELLAIIDGFQEHGIDAVPFKGPALAQIAYGDITLRSFSDLDILVKKQNVLKAKDLLISRGYKPEIEFTSFQERLFIQDQCEYNLSRDGPSIRVEIHWTFHPQLNSVLFDDGVWQRLETINLEGAAVNSFASEDLVLALCSHAAKHQWNQLKLVSDLAGLILRNRIDWDQVAIKADNMGLKRILHIGLILVHDLLDVELPEQIFNEIESDAAAKELALYLSENLFSKSERQEGLIESRLFWPKTRERSRDNARYFLFLGFEPTKADWDVVPLPEPLYPLYRIIRPFRLIYRYGLNKKRS